MSLKDLFKKNNVLSLLFAYFANINQKMQNRVNV
uniref:Uncharacterized protein n=1 Tax=Anguilla anguilla TaxID=7936 RepID=A0A0E9S8N4_ANGAN